MRSNICKIGRDGTCLSDVLNEVEKAAEYNGLDKKKTLRLRLLAEELVKMIPELLEEYVGSFWVECEGKNYELHALMKVDNMNPEKKGDIISVSKSGKNAAASGIIGMIRNAVDDWILYTNTSGGPLPVGFCDHNSIYAGYDYTWSMEVYMLQMEAQKRKNSWDELEKSIIAVFSDDVIVGVQGRQIEIIVTKDFGKAED